MLAQGLRLRLMHNHYNFFHRRPSWRGGKGSETPHHWLIFQGKIKLTGHLLVVLASDLLTAPLVGLYQKLWLAGDSPLNL
jgi:hypothetical protein